MSFMGSKSAARHADKKNCPIRLLTVGIASIAAGATLLGFVSPALAADNSTDQNTVNEQIAAASKALEKAKATLTDKKNAADQATAYKAQGTAGYFKYVGATGAYQVLTDSTVNGKLAPSIKLGDPKDATSIDNMVATMEQLQKANQLRVNEGKPELKVSDTLMAIAQADVDWASTNIDHPQQFTVGENLSWGNIDPFISWYNEEKAAHDFNVAHPSDPQKIDGHYLNIVSDKYDITGFAKSQYPNPYNNMTYGQTFYMSSAIKSVAPASYEEKDKSQLVSASYTHPAANIATPASVFTAAADTSNIYAGSRTMTVADYTANLKTYQNWIADPQKDVSSAQATVDNAQAAYDALIAKQQPKPGNTPTAPKPPTPDHINRAHGTAPGSKPASDPMQGRALPKTRTSADPAKTRLAQTGSNILGVVAVAIGLCLTAVSAFVLKRKTV